jgi:hypothetical protein
MPFFVPEMKKFRAESTKKGINPCLIAGTPSVNQDFGDSSLRSESPTVANFQFDCFSKNAKFEVEKVLQFDYSRTPMITFSAQPKIMHLWEPCYK